MTFDEWLQTNGGKYAYHDEFARAAWDYQRREIEAMKTDQKRLEWMQFTGAAVTWASDDEFCFVHWADRDGEYRTRHCDDWREAIDSAMSLALSRG